MSEMNGAAPPALTKDQLDVVKELETLLVEARAGAFVSYGFIGVSPIGGINVRGTKNALLAIYFGADALKDGVKAAMQQQAMAQAATKPKILRAGPGSMPSGFGG